MSLIGLQTYLAFKISFLLPNKKFLFISLLFGLIIPEIDIIISIYDLLLNTNNINYLFNKTFSHSIITLSVIYLLCLIIYEIKKDDFIINIGKGIIIGALINIIIDIIFRLNSLNLFWPLPIGSLAKLYYPKLAITIIMTLELLSFRLIASELIKTILNKSSIISSDSFIQYLSYWMKAETIFIILFIMTAVYKPNFELKLFIILYTSSYLMLLYSLFTLRKRINIPSDKT